MEQVILEILPKKQAKLTITVPFEEMRSSLKSAALHISQQTQIPGFRPGKADYESIKRHVGEMKIYEEALDSIVRHAYVKAILDQNLQTIGSPSIHVEKMAPGNDLVFIAEITLLPQVLKLADYTLACIEKKETSLTQQEIDKVLKELQRLQTKEIRVLKDEIATDKNKVVIDMEMKKEHVPIEGGQGKDHVVYLNESYYIPGFTQELIGLKEGEQKTFSLNFPKEHYQKHLAGSCVEFDITLKEIYHLEHPPLDDLFASSLGQKDFTSLKNTLKENMEQEKKEEELIRQEKALLELLAEKSQFEDLPDLLINEEIEKMLEELKLSLLKQNLELDDYLKKIGKTLGEIKLDFAPEALKRIKIALIVQEVAKKEDIKADSQEVDSFIEEQKEKEKKEEGKKYLSSSSYHQYVEIMMRNRRVLDFLKEKMIQL
jgi:trigger factor